MKRIYKYLITAEVIKMPPTAEIIHVLFEGHPGDGASIPTVWAWVEADDLTDAEKENVRQFRIIPTGFEPVPDSTKHLATAIDHQGFVWHLVEVMRS